MSEEKKTENIAENISEDLTPAGREGLTPEQIEAQQKEFERARYEKEFDETQRYIQMVMKTIFGVIILVVAVGLRFAYHVNDLLINGLLVFGAIFVGFNIIAVFSGRKKKEEDSGTDSEE